ncbi:MAG: CoA-binding protein [Candidatus Helarchaeota archaeon]|nr:CoA-binding protein [Candidatus Helarchaeota archaeon]
MNGEEPSSELTYLFHPKNIAVIGASENLNKFGGQVLYNLKLGNYQGNIFPINPKRDKVAGKTSYKTIKHVPEPLDLVISVIPNYQTPQTIEDCVDVAAKFVIINTAGFKEIAQFDENGMKYYNEIVRILKQAKGVTRTIGPNCMGLTCPISNLNAMLGFLPLAKKFEDFNISVTSQSGTWTWSVVNSANSHGVGIANAVSNGNELDLKFEDFVEYFGFYDNNTNAIVGYVEGFRNFTKIKKIAAEISEKKPIIILKGGRTESGAESARSHTSAIAGNYDIFKSFCNQTGIIEARNFNEIIGLARAIKIAHPDNYPKNNRVTIFTGGGGEGVIISDIIESCGLRLAKLQQHTIDNISTLLPPIWPHNNPVDTVGATNFVWMDIKKILEILIKDENTDIILIASPLMGARKGEFPPGLKDYVRLMMGIENITFEMIESFDKKMSKDIIRIAKKTDKLIIFTTIYYNAQETQEYKVLEDMFDNGILVVSDPEAGAQIIQKMLRYKNFFKIS